MEYPEMPNPEKTTGQKLVEEWRESHPGMEIPPVQDQDLSARIDRLIAELTQKRVLDLRHIMTLDPTTCSRVVRSVRLQLPDVEVRT
jgi:hypothetical protein